MVNKKNYLIISLGGSVIVENVINEKFLKGFSILIKKKIQKNKRPIILTIGGGKICRFYQAAARHLGVLNRKDLDWIGIRVTHVNAQLLLSLFRNLAFPKIITNPTELKKLPSARLIVVGGGTPGWSTDYDAVYLANLTKGKEVINITNVPAIYDKDPRKFKNARPYKRINYSQIFKMMPQWKPGLSFPFDPRALKLANKSKIKIVIMGSDIKNLKNFFAGKDFKGTIIE